MRRRPALVALALLLAGGPLGGGALGGGALAQSKSTPPSMGNTASVRTHLEALHYQGVQDLRRGPDGQWTGTAVQGNVPKTVTILPDGTAIAR